jgi:hypothetical protein
MREILFSCPHCQKRLAADVAHQGVALPCTDCGESVCVPQAAVTFRCVCCGAALCTAEGLTDSKFVCPACQREIVLPKPPAGSAGAPGENLFQRRDESALSRVKPQFATMLMLSMAAVVAMFVLLLYVDPLIALFRRSPEADPFLHRTSYTEQRHHPLFVDDVGASAPFAPSLLGSQLSSGDAPASNLAEGEAFLGDGRAQSTSSLEGQELGDSVDDLNSATSGPAPRSGMPVLAVNAEVAAAELEEGVTDLPDADVSGIEIAPLQELRTIFESNLSEIGRNDEAGVKALGVKYLSELVSLRGALQAAGDLDGYLAATAGAEAFAETGDVSAVGRAGDALTALQQQYRLAREKSVLARSRKTAQLGNRYLVRLEQMQRDYVLQDDIPRARRVALDLAWLQSKPVVNAAGFIVAEAEALLALAQAQHAAETGAVVRTEMDADALPPPAATVAPEKGPVEEAAVPILPRFSMEAALLVAEDVSYKPFKLVSVLRASKRVGISVEVSLGVTHVGDRSEHTSHEIVDRLHEERLAHTLQLALRVPTTPGGLQDAVAVAQYFAVDAGASTASRVPREIATEFILLPALHHRWLYVVCPPVETWATERDVLSRGYRRAYRIGLRFEGVVISVFGGNGVLLYQGYSARSLRKKGLATLPRQRR